MAPTLGRRLHGGRCDCTGGWINLRLIESMRRSKEIVVLFILLIVAATFVVGYVINRRAKNQAAAALPTKVSPPPPAHVEAPGPIGPVIVAQVAPTVEPKRDPVAPLPEVVETPAPVLTENIPLPPAPAVIENKLTEAPSGESPPPVAATATPEAVSTATPEDTVELGGTNEGKTIDFTTGKPVATESEEDKAIIEKALKDMAEAKKNIVFKASKKPPEPPPKPVEN